MKFANALTNCISNGNKGAIELSMTGLKPRQNYFSDGRTVEVNVDKVIRCFYGTGGKVSLDNAVHMPM